jgi:hypothetical protein
LKSFAVALLFLAAASGPAAAQTPRGGDGGGRAPASVMVVNELEQGVTVWINGELKGRVEPSGRARFDGVPSGPVSLKAGAEGSAGPVAGEERTLEPGETFTWTVYPVLSWGEEKGTGTLVLENGLDGEVEVLLNGEPAGVLTPGATRAYPRVVAGEVEVVARVPGGETVQERAVPVVAGNIARWEIGPVAP